MPKPRSKPNPVAAPRSRQDLWICLALLLVTFAVYAQVLHFDFVNFDDPEYIARNAHVRNEIGRGVV